MKHFLKKSKVLLSVLLSLVMVMSSLLAVPIQTFASDELPDPVYKWNFEADTVNSDTKSVYSIGSKKDAATLIGDAEIVEDAEKGSNVLRLPGNGSLTLPESLFSEVTTNGLTLSILVKADTSTGTYTKLFDASNAPLGETNSGASNWSDPDFAIAAGGGVYDHVIYVGAPRQSTNVATKINWDKHIKGSTSEWKHVVVSMSPSEYSVYMDGEKLGYRDAQQNSRPVGEVLTALFAESGESLYINTLKYASIGKSYYTSDSDFIGYVDDITLFNQALTEEQVSKLFGSDIELSKAGLSSLTVGGNEIKLVEDVTYYEYTEKNSSVRYTKDDFVAVATSDSATIDISESEANTFIITVTSGNGKNNKTYTVKIIYASNELPEADYFYTFEDGTYTDKTVHNQGSRKDEDAILTNRAAIETDPITNSKVAVLPGGSVGAGHITLSEKLFEGVTAQTGFTLSLWMYADKSADEYARIFTSSNGPLGQSYYGNSGNWRDPEFAFALGKDGAGQTPSVWNSAIMVGNPGQSASIDCKLVWNKGITRGLWQHVVLRVTGTSYDIYIDGERISYSDKNNNLSRALTSFFQNLATYEWKYNAIGQSIYTSDNDTPARIDNIRFYKRALSSEEIAAINSSEGDDINALLTNINVKGTDIPIIGGQYRYIYEKGESEVTVDDITVTTAVPSSTAEITVDPGNPNLFIITVTSRKGAQLVYTLECVNELDGAVINFNALNRKPLFQRVAGHLYGVSEPNVPTIDLLSPLKPGAVDQKPLDGLQHPSGDAFRVEATLLESGVEHILVNPQDMYLEWPYEQKSTMAETLADYNARVINMLRKMQDLTGDPALSNYCFVLFNEPNGIWFSGNASNFFAAWKELYTQVKQLNPNIKVGGSAASNYSTQWVNNFLTYCYQNNCLPEYVIWHELSGNSVQNFRSNLAQVKPLIKQYYTDEGRDEPVIIINEYAMFKNMGAGGSLIPWLAMFEEEGVYACLAFWGLANSLNELAADANVPNSGWWLYKWYADMTGERMTVSTSNTTVNELYGIGAIDEANKTVYAIFGGDDGIQTAYINGLANTNAFNGAKSVHVKLYSTSYSGQHGEYTQPYVEFEGNMALRDNGSLRISLKDCDPMDVYYAIITPATSDDVININEYNKIWKASYEAEDARLIGRARAMRYSGDSDLARSGRGEVADIFDTTDGVEFTVNVPEDGKYELRVHYTVPAPTVNALTLEIDPSGQNRAIGKLVKHQLFIDDIATEILTYDSTVKFGYVGNVITYVDLTKGEHKIRLMHYGQNQSSKNSNIREAARLDKIDLICNTEINSEPVIRDVVIEAEEIIRENSGYSFNNELSGFTGGGYVEGQGDFKFTVVAPKDGLYDVQSSILEGKASDAVLYKQTVDFGSDARATSHITTKNFRIGTLDDNLKIYLAKGANTLTISSSSQIALDKIVFSYDAQATTGLGIVVEAEDCELNGNPVVIDNEYASGGKMVDNITIGRDPANVPEGAVAEDNYITFNVNVEKAGMYALTMFYSNNEPAPVQPRVSSPGMYVHPYNTDLVERYVQVVVNDNEPETVYCRNTFSWDKIKTVVINVELKEGENTIVMYNDNTYRFSSLVNDAAPRFDKFIITPAFVTGEVPKEGKPFIITPVGGLVREGGIQATASISLNPGADVHPGTETVVFQLMDGDTPVSIVALEKDITTTEQMTAYFNVDPEAGNYIVEVYVFDKFDNSNQNAPIILADYIIIQ